MKSIIAPKAGNRVPLARFRLDYASPAYWVRDMKLDFDIYDRRTAVKAELTVHRNAESPPQDRPIRGRRI